MQLVKVRLKSKRALQKTNEQSQTKGLHNYPR